MNSQIREYLEENGISETLLEARHYIKREIAKSPPHYRAYNKLWELKNGSGKPVTEIDWDNLIILDACRYDAFTKMNPFDQEVKKRVTLGSNTTEFLKRNFLHEKMHDTVYTSANAKTIKLENGDYGSNTIFHHIDLFRFDEWDKKWGTVMPESVKKRGIKNSKKFPDKRLIIHFVQPHIPYIGETAYRIRKELSSIEPQPNTNSELHRGLIKDMVNASKKIKTDLIKEMYYETLSITLEQVEDLVEELDGKTVITSDHGEMFGGQISPLGKKIYGHPMRHRTDNLCIVPLIELDYQSRKKVTEENPLENSNYHHKQATEQLKALGYT